MYAAPPFFANWSPAMNRLTKAFAAALIVWSTSAFSQTPDNPYCGIWEYTQTYPGIDLTDQRYLKIEVVKHSKFID
jgi:hypothetical protein